MKFKHKYLDNKCILNFSEEYVCDAQSLLTCDAFIELFDKYLAYAKENKYDIYKYLLEASGKDVEKMTHDCLLLYKLLLVMNAEEVSVDYPNLRPYFSNLRILLRVVEGVYFYWRRLQRYCIISNTEQKTGLEDAAFLESQENFQRLILDTYRQLERSLGHENNVYRQIIAGVNAALSLNEGSIKLPSPYEELNKLSVVERVTIHPPFITYSKQNTRDGVFNEVFENPILNKKFNKDEWYCYPIRVGSLVAFVYFHEKFMNQGVSLCNLFSMAETSDYDGRNPDLVFVFGCEDNEARQCFYHDKENNIMLGLISHQDKYDYFGYMKKMILTLHNLVMINNDKLPIHGAMVEISFKSGKRKTIVIMGDSGAGKSETIEQIKALGKNQINEIKTVYDDMGVLYIRDDGKVVSSGTEIGAFVRLDDLETGVGYREVDRSVFMNPDKVNARIVTPMSFWRDIVADYKIDYFLYANNYEDSDKVLDFFEDADSAIEVFRSGKRMTKGTTTEKGISTSFFANPFGPCQRQEQCEKLLDKYFNLMKKQGVKLGQIRTRLGVSGYEKNGPKLAARELFDNMTNK